MSRRAALWLGAASTADYAAQMLLPALLVRTLAPADFGGYRLLWMSAQTAGLILSLNMALNLVYLAARHPLERRGALLVNAVVYLLVVGLLAGALSTPLLQALAAGAAPSWPAWALPLFVAAWMASLPFDHIGLAAGQPRMQARLMLAHTVLRVALLGGAALWFHDLAGVAAGMIALAGARLAATLAFARHSGAFPHFRFDLPLAATQLRYGVAFGLGASLFALRAQVDGWIAAGLFDPQAVATISIALTIVPIIGVVRQAFTSATVSDVAALMAAGRQAEALDVNRRANVGAALLVMPLVGAFVAVAPDAIALVYTPVYAAAAMPARIYAIAYGICVLETTTVVQCLGDGRFVMRTGAVLLVAGALAAFVGATGWGLPGIATGSLVAMWVGSAWNLRHVMTRCASPLRTLQRWGDIGLLAGLACAAACATTMGLAGWANDSHLLRVLAGGGGFTLVYGLLLWVLPRARRLYLSPWQPRPAEAPSHA